MKLIKMLGLAVVMALTTMAFVGSSLAAAESTSLCSGDGSGCGVTHVHETSVGKAKLLTSIVNVECSVLFLGDTASVAEEGAPFVIQGNFTYTNCENSCTVEEASEGIEIEVLKLGHETADVVGEGEVHVSCSGLNCYYNGESLKGTAKGPLLSKKIIDFGFEGEKPIEFNLTVNGEVSIQEQKVTRVAGLFCPATSKLDITTTPLSKTYLGSASAHYCVLYEHGYGHYLGVSGGVCQTQDATRRGNYELVRGPSGIVSGTMVCVRVSLLGGLYLSPSTAGVCANDGFGYYELGTVQ